MAKTPRVESKGAKILALIGRPKGATLPEIMKNDFVASSRTATSSPPPPKKHGLNIESAKTEAGDRVYQIKK